MLRIASLLLAACGTSPREPQGPTDAIDQAVALIDAQPFGAEGVAARLGVTLAPGDGSNEAFTVYRGGPVGPFTGVEVREPTSPGGGLVVLTIGGCVDRTVVGDRFGPLADQPVVRSPHAPADAERYEAHPQPWGEVRLGYSPGADCLRTVILDAT